jgi:outer membrane protein
MDDTLPSPHPFHQRSLPQLDWRFRAFATAVLVAGCVFGAPPSRAETLAALLERARVSEPAYLAARSTLDAAKAREDQAFGAMLPQVSGAVGANWNERTYTTRDSATPTLKDRFGGQSAQMSLTQPLLRYANYEGWRQAGEATLQAEHQLSGAEQELFAKLAGAWFDVMASRDNVSYTTRQAEATQGEWEVAQGAIRLGTGSLPEVEEAKAKHEQALADAVATQTEHELKQAVLEQIVGALEDFSPPFLRENAPLADLGEATLEQWLSQVDVHNPGILAASRALEASAAELRKEYGGHLPTLDLVGSYGQNSQSAGNFPGQSGYDIIQGTVGLQLNVPIYSGGTQSAKVREAVALKEKARLDLEAARRAARLATKQAWHGSRAARARTQGALQALTAADVALSAARRGVDTGLGTELDVLQAMQQREAARRDLNRGRYDQIVSQLKLKAALGDLTLADAASLDALFVEPSPAVPALSSASAIEASPPRSVRRKE